MDIETDLYFLIAKFLEKGPCHGAAELLKKELEENEIIPKSVNWLGEPVTQDFNTYSKKHDHVGQKHLVFIFDTLMKNSTSLHGPHSSSSTRSLLSKKICSPLKDSHPSIFETLGRDRNVCQLGRENQFFNFARSISGRSIYGTDISRKTLYPDFFTRIEKLVRVVGHLSAVYCVLFDNTGKFVITGADDSLVKIWSALDGRLLATLRGASAEIADLAINNENTLLAVGSCDKIIRVWDLSTCAPIAILQGQGGSVTSIFFCPIPRSVTNIRYLASTSSDGSCAFWAYTDEGGKVEFQPKPTIYNERMRPGACQMICSSFSSGGLFFASGSADCNVRVYYMLGAEGPQRVLEVECHTDRVDSLSWAHKGVRFISGSKDGTALVWRFEHQQWKFCKIFCTKALPGQLTNVAENPKNKIRVTMVAWNLDDSLVIAAVSNHLVKIYNPKNGNLVRVLEGHTDEAFIIEPHPKYPSIICTAGHDGRLIIWDIGTLNSDEEPSNNSYSKGKILFEYFNELSQGQGHGSIFDTKWSSDGLSLVATDSHGHVILFGASKDPKFKRLPPELFFHTDYRPLFRDAITHQILDEQTQIEPHLMPPPFLVDMEGNPYPPHLQRLVPGRGNCKDEQLIPNFAIEGGIVEIIEGIPIEEENPPANPDNENLDGENIQQPIAQPEPVLVVAGNLNNPRSNIDELIEQLAIENQLPGENNNNQNQNTTRNNRSSGGTNGGNERRGLALRRAGDIEGVRQSRGNWQRGTFFGYRKKYVVSAFTEGELKILEDYRFGHYEVEEDWYNYHTNTPPAKNTTPVVQVAPALSQNGKLREIRSKRLRKLAANQEARNTNSTAEPERFGGVEGIARPNPPQEERTSYVLDSPSRNVSQARRAQSTQQQRPRPTRRIRFDVRRLLRQHAPEGQENDDPPNENDVEAIPSDDPTDTDASPSSDSDSSSETSESDWGTRTKPETKPQTKTNNRRSKRRSSNENENGDDSDQEQENENDNESEESENEKPGPSSKAKKPSVIVKTELPKTRPRNAKQIQYGFEDIEEPYRPSEWLSGVMPNRNPYFPQLGDDLVYFRQGHELYINEVNKQNVYPISKKDMKQLPYIQNPQLPAAVSVRVSNIKYEILPPRVVSLKLAITDWKTGEFKNSFIYVKYHDMNCVVDFLILRQIHDKSLRHNWNENDRFRCLIDSQWWLGKIVMKKPIDDHFPDSKFLCYQIQWDNEDLEPMSPWDMDIIPDDFEIPSKPFESLPASAEDLRAGLYEVQLSDWPPHGHQEAECERISNKLEAVMELAISEAFLTPVDLNMYPQYAYDIVYPMDLSTIKSRLNNHFYRRIQSLCNDLDYIKINAEKFNQPKSDIVRHARVIRNLCKAIAIDPNFQDVNAFYKNLMKNPTDSSDSDNHINSKKTKKVIQNEEAIPGTSNGSSSGNITKSKRKGKKRNNYSSDDEDESDSNVKTWEEECHDFLNDIWNCKDATPFRQPVDITEFPDYYRVIETPMNFLSIREDLAGGNYSTPVEFAKDVQLIFNNSKTYNPNKKSKIYTMTLRLQSRCDYSIKEILSNWKKNKRKSGQNSPMKSKANLRSSSTQSSPRKSTRTRIQKHDEYVDDDDYSSDESPRSSTTHNTRLSTAARKPTTASPSMRNKNSSIRKNEPGPSTSTTSSGRVIRPVKRLRIDSSDSNDDHTKHNTRQQQQPVKKLKVLLPVTDNNPKTKSKILRNNLRNLNESSAASRPRRSTAGQVKREILSDGDNDDSVEDDEDDEEFVPEVDTTNGGGRPKRKTAGKNKYTAGSDDNDEDFSPTSKSTRKVKGKAGGVSKSNQIMDSDSDEDEFEDSENEIEEGDDNDQESEVENDEAKIMPNLKPVMASDGDDDEDQDNHEEEESEDSNGLRRSKRARKPSRRSIDSSDSDNIRGNRRLQVKRKSRTSTTTNGRNVRETRNQGRSSQNYEEFSD